MNRAGFSTFLKRSRRASVCAPILTMSTCVAIITLLFRHVHLVSVLGTTFAASVAACATFARSYSRTQRYVRFAIRARLATKAEPDYDKLTRQFRSLERYVKKSAHPSPEIADALHEAEKRMGLRVGSTLALVVPLELILGVPHNCPAAAAMLYAGRHPVILVDDNLQVLLDSPDEFDKSFAIVVSVLCHELAHLLSWNTRWSRLVSIGELFVTTTAMAALVAYSLEHNVILGIVGAVIAAVYLAAEPALDDESHASSPRAIAARVALVTWVPFVIAGMVIGALPVQLTIGVTILALGLRGILSFLRRREELYSDALAAHALGSSDPLTNFFRTLSSHPQNVWESIFSTHPPISQRIKYLRAMKI